MPGSSRGNNEMYLNASTRKQACNACRRRKKRCDGIRPICSACAKWGADCVYTASPGPLGYPLSSGISIDSDPLSASAGMRTPAGLDRVLMIPNSNPPPCSGRSSPIIFAGDSALLLSDLDRDLTYADDFGNFPLWSNVASPPAASVSVSTSSSSDADGLQLSEAFFTEVHPLLPCIHQASYMRSLHSADRGAPALKWAILANAAHVHGDFAIQNQSGHYLQKALELIDMKHSPQEQPLRAVQAGLWCAYLLYRLGKTNWSATVLAQAYTLACLNRYHQIDDPDRSKKVVSNMTVIEREECRSTMWMLYLLDRQVNYLVGLHFVINDRLFSVNYPLDNMSLQNGLVVEEQPFRRNLDYLSTIEETDSKGVFFLRALCKAVALLGRVVEYKNMTPTSSRLDQQQQQSDFDALQSAVARLWLSLPECTHNLLKVDPEHVVHTVWLSTIMHTTSLILFYNTTGDVWLRGDGRLSGGDNFVCAFKSVQRILNTVRRAAGLSFRCLLNPMLAPSYFLCSRLLLIQHYRTLDPSYRLDLGLLQTVLERMRSESQAQLAQTYLDIIHLDSIGDKPAQSTFPFISPTDLCFLV